MNTAMRKKLVFVGLAMFAAASFSLYLMLEASNLQFPSPREDNELNFKVQKIQNDLQENDKIIKQIKDTIEDLAVAGNPKFKGLRVQVKELEEKQKELRLGISYKRGVNVMSQRNVTLNEGMCTLAEQAPPKVDVQMMDVFDILPFDNPDGGVWKQGYDISYDVQSFAKTPLKVFVVPHSHNDPGWIKTFETYYRDQTRHILNNMVDKLEVDSRRRFIWAEMSYFWLWWSEIDASKRERVMKLLTNKQLELVTSGWVMTDEANAHYFDMIDQMIEGNEYMFNELGLKPRSGWAIDPFGHSPTMAYILKRAGFKNMLIQRIHYSVKKHLSKSKNLEFMWRQNWDSSGSTDILCHMMPFYSYDVPHTCGPDPKICCQFDFKRLPGGKITCPWKINPVPITQANVAEKAGTLLDQYRKKAQLYQNNIVLVILGDDFRYDKPVEWDQQFSNYQMLFDHMNQQPTWYVEAKFATLSEYFDALHERAKSHPGERPNGYPVLSGDFFTYADREDHYWSGYFTSRPFYKNMDRILSYNLRSAEMAFTLAAAHARRVSSSQFPQEKLMQWLVNARRQLGLNQHHDAITGTAKDPVVVDYGRRMLGAINDMKQLISKAVYFLLHEDQAKKTSYKIDDTLFFNVDETRALHDSLPERTVIKVSKEPTHFVLYNSLGQQRQELVRLYVSSPSVEVKDHEGKTVITQTDIFWESNEAHDPGKYKVHFVASLPAVGIVRYSIQENAENSKNSYSTITMYNSLSSESETRGNFKIKRRHSEDYSIENSEIKAEFSSANGLLSAITKDGIKSKVEVEFVTYGTRGGKDRSGAYLFLPNGEAKVHPILSPFIRVIDGPLLAEVNVFVPNVEHVVRLPKTTGVDSLTLEIFNIVDIRSKSNFELAMRIKTDIENKDEFFTDLNGFQIQRRRTLSKLPLQANYYPMPSMAFIQDNSRRFSVLTRQSLGVSSLQPGWLEVMMDRTLAQDDQRGVGQGVKDNKRTPNQFRLLLENKLRSAKPSPSQPAGYPSLLAHTLSLQLVNKIHVLPQSQPGVAINGLLPVFTGLTSDLPCEVHLLNLRTMQNKDSDKSIQYKPKESAALLLHRLGIDCSFPTRALMCATSNGKILLKNLLKDVDVKKVVETSLTLQHDGQELSNMMEIQVNSMDINTYKVYFS